MFGKQPPNSDNSNNNDNFDQQFQNEINAIQNAMNSMMQGAFSSLFNELFNTSNREGSASWPGDFGANANDSDIVTIIDGRNATDSYKDRLSFAAEDAGYGGSDFKRLAHKAKQKNKGSDANDTAESSLSHSNGRHAATGTDVGTIFNLLYQPPPPALFMRARNLLKGSEIATVPGTSSTGQHGSSQFQLDGNGGGGWSFTSTTKRTIIRPDGTQETIVTRKSNGNTETIKQYQYPDGRKEEIREDYSSRPSSWWSNLFNKH